MIIGTVGLSLYARWSFIFLIGWFLHSVRTGNRCTSLRAPRAHQGEARERGLSSYVRIHRFPRPSPDTNPVGIVVQSWQEVRTQMFYICQLPPVTCNLKTLLNTWYFDHLVIHLPPRFRFIYQRNFTCWWPLTALILVTTFRIMRSARCQFL